MFFYCLNEAEEILLIPDVTKPPFGEVAKSEYLNNVLHRLKSFNNRFFRISLQAISIPLFNIPTR